MVEFEEVYTDLKKFVVWLSNKVADSHKDADLMNSDDVASELYLELWKGYERYKHLPYGELKAVIRRMMDNRISELRYRFFMTHRKQEIYNISLHELPLMSDVWNYDNSNELTYEEKFVDYNANNATDPLYIIISNEFVLEVRVRLSDEARRIFDAIIYGDERLNDVIELSSMRNSYAYKNGGTLRIRMYHVADALCMNIRDVKVYWNEIRIACNMKRTPRVWILEKHPKEM